MAQGFTIKADQPQPDPLYTIEEESTTGWSIIEPEYTNLTKERAQAIIGELMSKGHNPERLRVVRTK